MKSKVHQEEEDDEEEHAPSSNSKDGKSNEKATVTRSKHSVTEQKRRSKINERFQILRDLIPHSDQKRDTASFLVEVIEYVQYLQEKVQKYEGSFQEWNTEPTKLMPWRNSHWRMQSFGGPIQSLKNDAAAALAFPRSFDDNDINTSHSLPLNQQNENMSVPVPGGDVFAHPLQPSEPPLMSDTLDQQENLMIEGGTISIQSVYTQGLLNNINQALQNAGVDLSRASVSVQIDIGKRANREPANGVSAFKEAEGSSACQQTEQFRNASNGSELHQTPKRPKI